MPTGYAYTRRKRTHLKAASRLHSTKHGQHNSHGPALSDPAFSASIETAINRYARLNRDRCEIAIVASILSTYRTRPPWIVVWIGRRTADTRKAGDSRTGRNGGRRSATKGRAADGADWGQQRRLLAGGDVKSSIDRRRVPPIDPG